jgi:hypothetical protein
MTPVAFDAVGTLYGTLPAATVHDVGKVYTLTPSNGSWVYDVIYSFGALPDAQGPSTGLIFDRSGNIFGLTSGGGTGTCGTVYQLIPSQSGWTDRILHNFNCTPDGQTPAAGPILDFAGNLYGGTLFGGTNESGMVFAVNESGESYNPLYSFKPVNCTGGIEPWGAWGTLSMDGSGNIYGTTLCGGIGYGSVFELQPSAGGWTYTELYDFQGGSDGGGPNGATVDANGNIYGTANSGGAHSACCGVVWEIRP